MANNALVKIPTLEELIKDTDASKEQNKLMVLLNQPPPPKWLKEHPTAKAKNDQNQDVPALYMPINKVEYILSKVYPKWWVEIKSVQTIANSVVVTVRLNVINPIDNTHEWNDGVGASPIQTDKGAGAMDWNKAKSAGVMIAAPAAETYAVKDAAEKFGKIFGRDLNRRDVLNYDSLLKYTNGNGSTDDAATILRIINSCKNEAELTKAKESLSTELQEKYAHELNSKLDTLLEAAQ